MEAKQTTKSPAVRWEEAKKRREELQEKVGLVAQAVGPGQDIPSPAMTLTAEVVEELDLLIKEEEGALAEFRAQR